MVYKKCRLIYSHLSMTRLFESKAPLDNLHPLKIHPIRVVKGMNRCGKSCTACPYNKTGRNIKINQKETCECYNCIYMISCEKYNCGKRYIGHKGRLLRFRLADHRGYITNQDTNKATWAHFNLPGHSLANLKVTIIEEVKFNNEEYRKERETYVIIKFNTFHKGIKTEK